jgi:hypothetical protein
MAELERQRVASAQAATTARRFESCCLRLSRSGVVELERRAVVTRQSAGSIPAAGASRALVVEAVMTPGPQPGSCGSSPAEGADLMIDANALVTAFAIWLWGSWPPHRPWKPGIAGSSPASQTLRGRGAVVLASLMSSRPWVRIPPARPVMSRDIGLTCLGTWVSVWGARPAAGLSVLVASVGLVWLDQMD